MNEESLNPIVAKEPGGPVECTFAQEGLWFIAQYGGGSIAYNVPFAWRLRGPLDKHALELSFQEIVRRQNVLRTVFRTENEKLTQVVIPDRAFHLTESNLESLPEREREAEAQRLIGEELRRPFDLAHDLLLRVKVLRLGPEEHILVLSTHHIIFDGSSMRIFFHELGEFYRGFSGGAAPAAPALPIQFTDFAAWQRKQMRGSALDKELAYWKEKLQGVSDLEISTDRPRPPVQSFRGETENWSLGPELTEQLKKLSRREGVTLFLVLLAALQTVLHRYSGQDDIVLGSAFVRRRAEAESLMGLFINVLPLRTDFSGNPTFSELLKRVRAMAVEAYEHQFTPFEKMVEAVQHTPNLSRNPIFQAVIVQAYPENQILDLAGLQTTMLTGENGTSKFDLSMYVCDAPGGVTGWLEYSSDLFDRETAQGILRHYRRVLESAAANANERVSALPMLAAEEERRMLGEWNETSADYPRTSCVHQLFEEQAARSPESTAVVFQDERATYRELNRRANQLAHHLNKLGAGPGGLVALYTERGVDMVTGLLGIMKSGAAYVPLDPAYPMPRLALMLDDSKPAVIVTQRSLESTLPPNTARVFCLDRDRGELAKESEENPASSISPEELAYVIYTSGSTGKPKGVQLPHRAVVNLLSSMARTPGISSGDVLLSVTSLSFDIAALELYLPLITGACVWIASRETALDGKRLQEVMKKSKATVMQATPATWHLLIEAGWAGNPGLKVLCGGEALPRELAGELLRRCGSLWNVYGPTETCIWSTVHQLTSASRPISIGRPIANTEIYFLDRTGQPVPVGVPGELHIGGDGLARGYLNLPELSAQKFIPHPFSRRPGARLYKTGDRGKYLADGTILLLGRADEQVKLRGYRIELGEIESVLRQMPELQQAAVIAAGEDAATRRLVAYVVPRAGAQTTADEMRRFVQERLPEWMIPSAWVKLDALPLTSNGKLDRRALPTTGEETAAQATNFVAPRDPLEKQLADIWEKKLGVARVGIHDNFFALGGHSMLAVSVLRQVERVTGKDMPLVALFQAPTIAEFAGVLRDAGWKAPRVLVAQPNGSKPPLFCIYDRFDYGNLTPELGEEQPIYILPIDGLFEDKPRWTYWEVASEFADRVRSVQPKGPYQLAGMCLGGRLAFAIANQLHLEGEEVSMLAIIDSPGPGHRTFLNSLPFLAKLRYNYLDDLVLEWKILMRLTLKEKIDIILFTLKVDAEMRSRIMRWKILRKYYHFRGKEIPPKRREAFFLLNDALDDYVPENFYPGKVILFRPMERPVGPYREDDFGWNDAKIGSLELRLISGRHGQMMQQPHVGMLGREISDCLRRAQEEVARRGENSMPDEEQDSKITEVTV